MNITVEPERTDSVRVTKTTRGYTWELKLYFNFSTDGYADTIKTLNEMNEKMLETFKQEPTQL